MAVPVFFLVYKKLYGGIDDLDAGKFYHDVKVIHSAALKDFGFYLRLLFGLQNDLPGTYDFEFCLKNTLNWDNGTVKDYLYNDNRVLIRVHSLIDFIAFNSYTVHALISCFMSFIGIQFIYRTFKIYFQEKELQLILILCFVPALWFYTGALLKEGLAVFILGNLIYLTRELILQKSIIQLLKVLPFIFLACLLKPYLLLFVFFSFALFFFIQYVSGFINKSPLFFIIVVVSVIITNFASEHLKQRSLLEAALKHQRLFAGVAKGGIFLAHGDTFVRLKNDSTQISAVKGRKNLYTIHKNVNYMYWEHNLNQDTLYCAANSDTLRVYELKYTIKESKSNIQISSYQGSAFMLLGHSFYYSLFFPMFTNAKGLMQLLASCENLAVLVAFLMLLYFFMRSKKKHFFPLVLLFVCLSICFLVGLATPNSGAIYRYRSPVISFVFIAVLYYLPIFKIKKSETAN
ncbi:MAG: hypothetical protein WCR21_02835 [Bacteroidota bacterium]